MNNELTLLFLLLFNLDFYCLPAVIGAANFTNPVGQFWLFALRAGYEIR